MDIMKTTYIGLSLLMGYILYKFYPSAKFMFENNDYELGIYSLAIPTSMIIILIWALIKDFQLDREIKLENTVQQEGKRNE